MDKWLGIMRFAIEMLLYKYHPLLQLPIALNMVPASEVEGRLVSVFLGSVEEDKAVIRWQVSESLAWGAPIISEGYVSLAKMQTGFWRTESTRLVK